MAHSPDEARLAAPSRASRESSRVNSRADLVDAAFEEFSAKGYEAATLADIAERAGVTTGAVYAHFTGKLELLLETVGTASVEDFTRVVGGVDSLPWDEAASFLVQGLATATYKRTLLLLDVIVVARRDPTVAEILRKGLERYLSSMTRATDAGVALGRIDPALPTDELTRVLAVINFGMIIFTALGERTPSRDALARIAELLLQSSEVDRTDEPAALARVQSRAAALDRANQALVEGIFAAVEDGHSLRQVGAAAGLSHEHVRQLLREQSTG